jgi:hypothetical protein
MNDFTTHISFYTDAISQIPDKGPSPHPTMGPIEITENGVFKLLSNLKVYKAAGPDLIPTQHVCVCYCI